MAAAFAWVEGQMASEEEDPWVNSPYAWVRQLQSRTRGKAGELFAERWLSALGYDVERAGSGDGDRLVGGMRVEVKFSTQWTNGGLRFSQLRDQDYSHVILIGVEPQRLRIWVVDKHVIWSHATGQHTGGEAAETRWVAFDPATVPAWLTGCGGEDKEAAARALDVFGPAPPALWSFADL